MSPAIALTNPALWQYLTAIGAAGTYAMNKDKVDNFAGSFRFPGFGRRNPADDILWKDGTVTDGQGTVISAAPGATGSELDAKTIVTPAGALVHQPAGALVGGSGNGGNDGGNWDQDPKFLRGARYGEIPANFISNQISDVVDRFLNRSDEVDPYEAGEIEREENEWGPGGQPSASEQTRIYEQSGWRNSPRYGNSPAARSGAFTEEQLGRQKQLHDDFKEAQRSGTMEEFVRQYPQSQTAKEYAIRRRIPSSLDMEF